MGDSWLQNGQSGFPCIPLPRMFIFFWLKMFPGFETLETQILKLLTAFSMQFKEFQVFSYYFTQLIVQLSFPIKLHFLFSVITFLWSFHNQLLILSMSICFVESGFLISIVWRICYV